MPPLDGARIAVVGGAGFIGSHIVDQLLAEPVGSVVIVDNFVRGTRANIESAVRDERVEVVEGSIADPDLLRRTFEGADYVFHLAALWLFECVHHPRDAIDINVVGAWNVIEAALDGEREEGRVLVVGLGLR